MPNLFAGFCGELVKVTVGIGYEKNGGGTVVIFVYWSEPQSIDWTLLFDARIDLGYFVVGAQVEDSDEPVGVSAGSHGVLLVELGDHQLVLLGYDCFHEDLVFEGDLFDDFMEGFG